MGLRSEAQADLASAFDTDLSDVVTSFTLIKSVNGEYDPIEGSYTETKTNYSSRGIFEDFGIEEINNNSEIKSGDVKLIVIANEISVIPEVDDIINNYTVVNVKNVFDITYEVQLRGQ